MNDESLDPKRQTLIAALYGELNAEELATFEALLRDDAALRAEWNELRETRALLESATVNEPAYTPEFVFIDRAQAEPKSKRRFAWLPAFSPAWGFASAAACLAILMGAGLRMDHVDNGLVLRFGPGPAPKMTTPATQVPPQQQSAPSLPIPLDGAQIRTTAEEGVTRDDLNQYSNHVLDVLTRLMDESEDRQRKEMTFMMGRFYEEMAGEQDRKYDALRQRMDGIGLGLVSEIRSNQKISRLTDQMSTAEPDSLATPRNPDKDKKP